MKKVNVKELKIIKIADRHHTALLKQAVAEIETQRTTMKELHERRAIVVSKLAEIDKIVRAIHDCPKKVSMIQQVCRSYFG